jgi:gas vesicle protein
MEQRSGIGYFLLGLGVGVAAGILWAPRAGEDTRQLIADKAGEGADYVRARSQEGREYVRQQADSLRESANDAIERSRSTVQRHKENLTAAVEAGKQAYRDAVSDLKSAAATQTGSSGTGGAETL